MYDAKNIVLNEMNDLFEYCEINTHFAKLFKNSVIYRLRQLHFAWLKNFKNLSEEQQNVINEF